MLNVLGVVSGNGRSRDALVFIAGRDNLPPGPGANDNGSGTGALVELARTLVGSVTQTSLVFASVDGTTAESAGARELARHPPAGLRLRAGIALRAVGRPGLPLVLRLSGEGHRLPAAGWLRTVEQALHDEGVQTVRLPSLGQQVAALVAPVVHGDQAALVGSGAAVVGIDGSQPGLSSAADTSKPIFGDLRPLSADLLGRVGTATQLAALAFDTGPQPASLGSTYLVSSDRVLRGWTLELFLVALLIPPIFALIDAAARARARGARPSITARRVLWRAGGLADRCPRHPAAGCDRRDSRTPIRRRSQVTVAGCRSGRSCSPWPSAALSARWRRAGCRWTPTPWERAATSAPMPRCSWARRSPSRATPICSCS